MKRLLEAYVCLLVLLGATVGFSFVDLGNVNGLLAFSLAAMKAGLVVMVFMEVWTSRPLVRIFCGASLLWLAILIVGPMHDYLTRFPLRFPLW